MVFAMNAEPPTIVGAAVGKGLFNGQNVAEAPPSTSRICPVT